MNILCDHGMLRKAAAALYQIDQAGSRLDLRDQVRFVRYCHRIDKQEQTIGEGIYIDNLASALHEMTDIDRTDCWHAVRDAVRPPWPSVALEEIIEYAEQIQPARRRA